MTRSMSPNRLLLQLVSLFTMISAITAQACGVLNGYPNAQPPACTGQASICTFSGTRQGCCDGSGHCTFYTSCNGGLATTQCTDASCLQCPKATPYCARYALGSYQGFGCGIVDMGYSIIYGSATIPPNTATLTSSTGSTFTTSSRSQASSANLFSSSLASSTQSSMSSLSPSLSTTKTSSITSSIISSSTFMTSTSSSTSQSSSQSSSVTKTSSAATFTGTSAASFQASKSISLSGGVIGGIVAGIVVLILLSALVIWFCCCRGKRSKDAYRRPQLQQGRTKAMSTYSDHYSS